MFDNINKLATLWVDDNPKLTCVPEKPYTLKSFKGPLLCNEMNDCEDQVKGLPCSKLLVTSASRVLIEAGNAVGAAAEEVSFALLHMICFTVKPDVIKTHAPQLEETVISYVCYVCCPSIAHSSTRLLYCVYCMSTTYHGSVHWYIVTPFPTLRSPLCSPLRPPLSPFSPFSPG